MACARISRAAQLYDTAVKRMESHEVSAANPRKSILALPEHALLGHDTSSKTVSVSNFVARRLIGCSKSFLSSLHAGGSEKFSPGRINRQRERVPRKPSYAARIARVAERSNAQSMVEADGVDFRRRHDDTVGTPLDNSTRSNPDGRLRARAPSPLTAVCATATADRCTRHSRYQKKKTKNYFWMRSR